FGVLPLLAGTALITAGAILVGLPLGLATAVYLSEYATRRVRAVLKPVLEVLAGIPTVVFGYFALNLVTPTILRPVFGDSVFIFNAASGGIVVGLMVLPTITSLSEDAMAAVPRSLRAAAYALGARRRTVALRVVIPAALSGIASATILGIARAVGETMAVTIAAGATPNLTWNPLESIQTMTAFIAQVASGDAPTGSVEYQAIFAVGLALFVITLALNSVSHRLVRRYRQAYA
ncbi:MAG: phosphate ABC transporter permease subunit PstC, partial [Actinobacteria bacterium]|nr:phosphate ABC transporter permease subunit PstC [Actinomycetota bacterium]